MVAVDVTDGIDRNEEQNEVGFCDLSKTTRALICLQSGGDPSLATGEADTKYAMARLAASCIEIFMVGADCVQGPKAG